MCILKKSLSFILICCILLSLAACGKPIDTPDTSSGASATEETTANIDYSAQQVVVNTDGMTELQKAIVITAESYHLRGNYGQYDMNTLANPKNLEKVERRQPGLKAAEDYTRQYTGYNDCSAFVSDVYRMALGMSIIKGTPWTNTFCNSSPYTVLKEKPASSGFADMTPEELAAKEKEFTDTLQPGDIIVYRYAGEDGGHAMLYVGNGMMIHCSGRSYDYTNKTEMYEEEGCFLYEPIADSLLKPGHRRYLFDKNTYVILRPLASFKGDIPEHTASRMEVMRGIMAEKLCSFNYAQTVNPGEEVTYTFYLANHSNMAKTLTVTDTVPEHTTYVSGAQTVEGNTLSWSVSVPAGSSAEVSYTVKVDATAAAGSSIKSRSTVSGINVNCPRIIVGNTLTKEQQATVMQAFNELKSSSKEGIELVNALYEKAFNKTVFTAKSISDIWSNLVLSYVSDYVIDRSLPCSAMIAPSLYGGRNIAEVNLNDPESLLRSRWLKEEHLIIGDVLVTNDDIYLFTDNGLWDLQASEPADPKRLETLFPESRFVILRPSLAF